MPSMLHAYCQVRSLTQRAHGRAALAIRLHARAQCTNGPAAVHTLADRWDGRSIARPRQTDEWLAHANEWLVRQPVRNRVVTDCASGAAGGHCRGVIGVTVDPAAKTAAANAAGAAAALAGACAVSVQMWTGASPVPVQMWTGVGPVPVQMWTGVQHVTMRHARLAAGTP